MQDFITGIQQIGIGVEDAREAMLLYKELFGMDVLIFDDIAEASLMTQYTGNETHTRRAILSLNMAGGGGFEIWQFLNRKPQCSPSAIQYGDLGINAAIIKCNNIKNAYAYYNSQNIAMTYVMQSDPEGNPFFYVKDKYNNLFKIVAGCEWFSKQSAQTAGVTGAVIGVSNMEQAMRLYKDVLGVNEVVYDVTGCSKDISGEGTYNYRRVLLRKHPGGKGAFYKLLGTVEIELVQCLDRQPQKIYKNRYWGDNGFIHLCLDVLDMDALKSHAERNGFAFTVDSNESFAMEAAAGRFCYLEDPDGTLIELVETHKVPVMKKYGLYLNLKKRGLLKPLPDWIVKLLALSKVK